MTASSSQPKLASLEQLEDTPRTGHLVQSSAASQVTKEDVRPSGSFSPDPSLSLPCKVESQHLPYPAWFPGTYTHWVRKQMEREGAGSRTWDVCDKYVTNLRTNLSIPGMQW